MHLVKYFKLYLPKIAIEMDESDKSHPIEVEVKNVSQIKNIFDHISYGKGASIIRMLVSFLGRDHLWKGLQKFIDRHKFGTVSTEVSKFGKTNSKIGFMENIF